uniref:LigA n=1 Tax=Parastrongyloides trichosuri TaxID=131310 RepID=A0A0N4ZVQ9_PARTI
MTFGHGPPLARLHRAFVGARPLDPGQHGDQQHRYQDQGARARRPEGEQEEAGQAIDIENVARKQQDGDIADAQHQQGHATSEIDVRRLDRALPAVAAQGDQQHPCAEQQGEQSAHRALQEDVLHQPGHPVGIVEAGRRLRHIGFPNAAHRDDVDQQDAAQGKAPQQVQAIQALRRRRHAQQGVGIVGQGRTGEHRRRHPAPQVVAEGHGLRLDHPRPRHPAQNDAGPGVLGPSVQQARRLGRALAEGDQGGEAGVDHRPHHRPLDRDLGPGAGPVRTGAVPRPDGGVQGSGHAAGRRPVGRGPGRDGRDPDPADRHQRRHRRRRRARLRGRRTHQADRPAPAGSRLAGAAQADDDGRSRQRAESGRARRLRRLPASGEGPAGRGIPARRSPPIVGQLDQLGPSGGPDSLLRLGHSPVGPGGDLRGADRQFRRRLRRDRHPQDGPARRRFRRRRQPERRPGPRHQRGRLCPPPRRRERQRVDGRPGAVELRASGL